MRSKRSVRLEAKWREIVSGHPCSGQTVRAYSKARQVTEASFYFWRRELERRAHPLAVRPQLIPIRILPDHTLRVQVRCPSGHVVRQSSNDGRCFPTCFAP
jgi:hypothetical protein